MLPSFLPSTWRSLPARGSGPTKCFPRLVQAGWAAVYRARDTRLNRDAAVKVLPESFAVVLDWLEELGRPIK